jgi:hypothetical protein
MDMQTILPSRRAILATGACTLIATGLRSTEARADLRLRGTLVKWQGTLPGDWIGGNVEMLEAAITDPALEKFRRLNESLLGMLKKGKTFEITCMNLDVSGMKTQTVSLLQVSKQTLKMNLANKKERDAFWKELSADVIRHQVPKGSEVKLRTEDADPARNVGGKPAYAAIFEVRQPGGGVSYEYWNFVALGGGDWHVIHMAVDGTKFVARADDVNALLRSIRYG